MADELIRRNAELGRTSANGGVWANVGGTAAYISSQQCRSCLIKVAGESDVTAFININGTATATCAELDTTWTPLPVANLSMVNVYSASSCAVMVIWRQ